MVVATALCADGKIANASAAPARPVMGDFARQLATRLSSSFQRTVQVPKIHQDRQDRTIVSVEGETVDVEPDLLRHPTQFSPFQFRLPPPTGK